MGIMSLWSHVDDDVDTARKQLDLEREPRKEREPRTALEYPLIKPSNLAPCLDPTVEPHNSPN